MLTLAKQKKNNHPEYVFVYVSQTYTAKSCRDFP